ncbi:hypothetical protein AMECASPLE_034710 [Ameca splendens]|uniref:Uncharacterized protein n=1 Tax=Ameca splendens TaxID=208324 RepID=A0ABV0ZH33_9TELE
MKLKITAVFTVNLHVAGSVFIVGPELKHITLSHTGRLKHGTNQLDQQVLEEPVSLTKKTHDSGLFPCSEHHLIKVRDSVAVEMSIFSHVILLFIDNLMFIDPR